MKYKPLTSDTTVGIIEKRYDVDLGVKTNMKLGNYLRIKGYPSLANMLKLVKGEDANRSRANPRKRSSRR